MGGEVEAEEFAEVLLGGAGWRSVVVGEVEVGDAEIEGAADDGAAGFEGVDAAEVVPEAEGDERKFYAALSATAVKGGAGVAVGGG